MSDPRHGGAYIPMVMELNDPKTAIEAKCSPKCAAVMDTYKECAKRIEEKGSGNCAGYMMDYHKCIDKCSVKYLMKELA